MLDPDLLAELTAPLKAYNAGCSIGRALDEMDDTAAATFRHALALPKGEASNVAIARAFSARGWKMGASTVGRHRLRGCLCDG